MKPMPKYLYMSMLELINFEGKHDVLTALVQKN